AGHRRRRRDPVAGAARAAGRPGDGQGHRDPCRRGGLQVSRWLVLYLRSRRAPMALGITVGFAILMSSLWAFASKSRDVGVTMVILTVLLMVSALTTTLVSPDAELDRTAARPWPPRRAAHVLASIAIVVAL